MLQSTISRILISLFDIIYRLMQGVFLAAILGALGNALYAFIQSGWPGLSNPEKWFLVVLIRSHPVMASIAAVALIFLFIAGWLAHQRSLNPADLSTVMLRQVKRVSVAEFPIGEKTPYLSRQGDTIDNGAKAALQSCLTRSRNGVLFVGHVESGKTRLAFESMQAVLPRWLTVIWFSSQPEIHEEVLLRCRGRKVVIFLDDLQDFAEQHKGNLVRDTVGRLRGVCRSLIVIATMRIEDENIVRREMGPFLQDLIEVPVPDVSEAEKQDIVAALTKQGVTTYPNDFDGTIGSLVQGLEKRRQVYRQFTQAQQSILKAIRLLDAGYVFPFFEQRVRAICSELFEVSLSEISWRADIAVLCEHGFVCPQSTPAGTELHMQLKPEVFRRVIVDYPKPGYELSDDLRRVREIFLTMRIPDADGVQAIETALSADEREREVQQLTHDGRMVPMGSVDWAEIQQKLGVAYLQRVRGDRAENVESAIKALKNAQTVFPRESFPQAWGETNRLLAKAYRERIKGERLTNLEQVIAYYEAALQVFPFSTLPEQWATIQHDLGNTYLERMIGTRRANLEQAITFYRTALQVYTRETFPEQWAMAMNNLGQAFTARIVGEKRANVEQAIAGHEAALEVFTHETFPEQWAMTLSNLGQAYTARIAGEKRTNVEKALDYFKAALQVYTRETFPEQWAMAMNNLGQAYTARIAGEKQENMAQAIACYEAALQVYSREASPAEYREIQLNRAFAETQCGNWINTHEAYMNARSAEDMLTRLSAGVIGRNAVLQESHDAATRDGFALTRLGQAEAAALVVLQKRRCYGTLCLISRTAEEFPS